MPERLESYEQYLERNNTQNNPEEARKYFAALHLCRIALAEDLGVTLEELHQMHHQTVAA